MGNGLVSIIIPTYNCERWVSDAIESSLRQSYPNREVIVIDDGSTDNTCTLISERYGNRVKYIRQNNLGLAAARNRGLYEAKGDYIQFLDSDDLIKSDKIEIQIDAIRNIDGYAVSYTDYRIIDINTNTILGNRYLSPNIPTESFYYSLIADWETRFSVPVHCFLFKSAIFRDNNIRFDVSLPNHEDWDCWIRIFAFNPKVVFVNTICAFYRIKPSSMCSDRALMRAGFITCIDKYINYFDNPTALELLKKKRVEVEKNYADVSESVIMKTEMLLNANNKQHAISAEPTESIVTLARAIAFYLPQFHPIPENDEWWGKGFTEWTNVAKARPLFDGHYQPHIPGELGFYDLRLHESRIAQAELAKHHGIEGFCYWHYWFNGKRLLERPFDEVLESGSPDYPFCLAWANESWSRRWLGEEKDILIAQTYSHDDDFRHIQWLIKAFKDSRYIRVYDRPLFLIYRPNDLPDAVKTTTLFREECLRHGVPNPYLVGINSHCWNLDCRTLGFDATLMFMPQLGNLPEFMNDEPSVGKLERNQKMGVESNKLKIYDYAEALESMLENRSKYAHPVIPSIFVGWDNTARRGENAIVITNTTPDVYGKALAKLVQEQQHKPEAERLIFINAWNEWAEGNHLEPDVRNGSSFLEMTSKVVAFTAQSTNSCEAIRIDCTDTSQAGSSVNNAEEQADHLYYHLQNPAEALPLYIQALEVDKTRIDSILALVSISATAGAFDQAQRLLECIHELDKDKAVVWCPWYKQVLKNPEWFGNNIQALSRLSADEVNVSAKSFTLFDNMFWFWMHTMGRRKYPFLRRLLPGLPKPEIQTGVTGTSGDASMWHGYKQYLLFKTLVERHTKPDFNVRRLLDFGCAYGRMLRFFIRDYPEAELHGADISESFRIWCEKNIPFGIYTKGTVWPPLGYENNMFDIIYSFSVFSHLSIENSEAWLQELQRICAVDGLVIVTVWSHPYRTRDYHETHFTDYDALIRNYEAGEFCFSNLKYPKDSVYAEALVPPAYIVKVWSQYFDILEIIEGNAWSPNQSYVVMRKKKTKI